MSNQPVIYFLSENETDRPNKLGAARPGVVVNWFGNGVANLVVFLDGQNDTPDGTHTRWITSALKANQYGTPGQWMEAHRTQ